MDDQLIKRLEAVTNRLELAAQQFSSNTSQSNTNTDNSEGSIDHLPIIQDYDLIINESLKPFVVLSQQIGGDLTKLTDYVTQLFDAQREFVRQAVQSVKLGDKEVANAIKPQSNAITAITDFRNKNRTSALFNHLSVISEGIPALGWIVISPTPGPYIKEMSDAAQFYSNRVLKDYKDKDPTHVEWVKLWAKLLNDLHAYVKKYHTTGLAWASQGKRDFGSVNTTKPAPAAGGTTTTSSAATTATTNSISGTEYFYFS